MSRQLGIAVVGAGRIGRMHAEIVAHQLPGARLVAVYDRMRDVAAQVARSCHCGVAADLQEVASSPDVDAVVVCTPTTEHGDAIVQLARAGIAILCEKPVAPSAAAAQPVAAALEQHSVPFMVGFNRRFDPGHHAVRLAVERGDIGDVHLLRISSRDSQLPSIEYVRSSGGLFVDAASHDFDMARYIAASPVVRVFAQGAVRLDPCIGEAGDIDTAATTLVHESGAITLIDNSRFAAYGYDQRVEAFGSKGMVQSDNHLVHRTVTWGAHGYSGPLLTDFFLERYREAYRNEWRAFLAYVTSGGPSPVSLRDGLAPLAIAAAAGQSVRTGLPVDIEPA